MLLRLACLGVAITSAMLRLPAMSDRDRAVEILAPRHQTTVLKGQHGKEKVRFSPSDRAFLAALRHRLPQDALRRLRLPARQIWPQPCCRGSSPVSSVRRAE
ncbi:hypothetical protein OG564_09135 [Streptomyces sp. NBC_01280]|uniref:hypothetical protein n=1 Tax=unclassified Streptomyces TaxID=2593676 RepID=UPI002E3306D5|nr:hypothetical protein [Streptomyces sp. NBC_01280]WSE18463.1 hypothetical protein OG518_36830 [Streptomyces sp. NBC_01397]